MLITCSGPFSEVIQVVPLALKPLREPPLHLLPEYGVGLLPDSVTYYYNASRIQTLTSLLIANRGDSESGEIAVHIIRTAAKNLGLRTVSNLYTFRFPVVSRSSSSYSR